MTKTMLAFAPIALGLVLAACNGAASGIQCRDAASCNQTVTGTCEVNPDTGSQWCADVDPACPSGRRWSDLDVGDGVAGECVAQLDADAATVDAATIDAAHVADASPDADTTDAAPGEVVIDFAPAELVLGQPDFSTGAAPGSTTATTTTYPNGLAVGSSGLWAIDGSRAMRWSPAPLVDNTAASMALGGTLASNMACSTATAACLDGGNAIATSSSKVAISDSNRVLLWNGVVSSGQAADHVLCRSDFTTGYLNPSVVPLNTADKCYAPAGVWTDGTRIAVADRLNNRVLLWNTWPTTNGAAADLVLGQAGFGMSTAPSAPSASNMLRPTAVYFDGSRLFVVDGSQHRVLVWNGWPASNGQAAAFALGQPDLTSATAATSASGLNFPTAIAVAGSSVYVSDFANDRIMVWAPIPSTSGVAARHVLGQPTFTQAGGMPQADQTHLDGPQGLALVGQKLYVSDSGHHRVLRFGLNLP